MNRDLLIGTSAGLGLLAAMLLGGVLIVIGDNTGHALSVTLRGMGWL
jgi:hypothetical protein